MALPPEPIETLLPQAKWVVEAVVSQVLATGERPPQKKAPPGTTSVGNKAAAQTVKLSVTRLLRGDEVAELTVEKPEAQYLLTPGNKGPFLIDAQGRILGRYGPDTWSLAKVEGALTPR